MLRRIPNILSVSRFPLSVLLVLFANQPARFIPVYIVTGITDVLDGWLARKFNWGTEFGAKLDGFADAFFATCSLSVIVVLWLHLQIEWYVIATLGTIGLLKLINLLTTVWRLVFHAYLSKQGQAYIKENFGYIPKICWIAHMKEICGLNPQVAANRRSNAVKMYLCPPEKQEDLQQAFVHFNWI